MMKLYLPLILLVIITGCSNREAGSGTDTGTGHVSLTSKENLGKLLFFEPELSNPPGQSCSSCHDPASGFADPVYELPVSEGAIKGLFGNRNDLPVAYSMFVPPLAVDKEGNYYGGLFWDGRADNLIEQAMGPPLNPLEMNNKDTVGILEKIRSLEYAPLFVEIYGPESITDAAYSFRCMADALSAYESSNEVNPFSSKYDLYLAGKEELTDQEIRGMALFIDTNKGNCAACHLVTKLEDGTPPLFTDFTYDNLGVPANPENPFYRLDKSFNPEGKEYLDQGLGAIVGDPDQNGKFRVPSLRNIEVTGPYMHNGVFKTLFEVVSFYNTRDVSKWPPPETAENVNSDELGDLGLTTGEMLDIVAFLKTLTDKNEQEVR